MLYWKPEQPPGLTPIRSARSSSPSCAMRLLTFSAALSVMLTMVVCSLCCISTSRAVGGWFVAELLHPPPYTSTPPSEQRADRAPQRLAGPRPPRGDAPAGPRAERAGVQRGERPLPPRQLPVGLQGSPVRGGQPSCVPARGVEVVRVGPGEPAHGLLVHAGGAREQEEPLGGRKGRRVRNGGCVGAQDVAQASREVAVQVGWAAAGRGRPLGGGDRGDEQGGDEDEERAGRGPVGVGPGGGGLVLL